jgi:glutathione S-transferase
VLEIHLSGKYTGSTRDYLAGHGRGKYSIADIGTWPWVQHLKGEMYTQEQRDGFPHVLKWIDRLAERDAVKRGIGEKYALPIPKEG